MVIEKTHPAQMKQLFSDITCYKGKTVDPQWMDIEPGEHACAEERSSGADPQILDP